MLIDTHAHLNFPDFEKDLDQVIDRSIKNGVTKIICALSNKVKVLKKLPKLPPKMPKTYSKFNKPLVSIIIITRNQKEFMEQTLPMIFNQTFKDFETIIVDSSSTNGVLAVMKKYRVKILHYKGLTGKGFNHAKAFNFGAKKAKGKYLVRLSGDAVPADQNWLKHLVRCISKPKVAGTSSRYLHSHQAMLQFRLWFSPTINRYLRRGNIHLAGASCAIKKRLWKQYPFNEEWGPGEDCEWGEVMKVNGFKIIPCWESKVYHGHRGGLIDNLKLLWFNFNPKNVIRHLKHFKKIRETIRIN